jgi:hypothetical protein
MTSESSRADAVKQGVLRPPSIIGVREWIERLTARADPGVVTFATSDEVRGMPGSAAKSAAKATAQEPIVGIRITDQQGRRRTVPIYNQPRE